MAFYDEPQWAVVGDTFPVGCAPRDSIVYGRQSFRDNADIKHPVYSKELGIYEKNCGLDKGCHSILQKVEPRMRSLSVFTRYINSVFI